MSILYIIQLVHADTRRLVQYCYFYMSILYIIQLVHADTRRLCTVLLLCTDVCMSIIILYSVGTRIQKNYNVYILYDAHVVQDYQGTFYCTLHLYMFISIVILVGL